MAYDWSEHLSPLQIAGVNKAGDVIVPGYGDLPSFAATRCLRRIDRLVGAMAADDLASLKLLLTIFGLLPRIGVAAILRLARVLTRLPGPVGALARFMDLGVRGLCYSLYYTDETILERIGWNVQIPGRPRDTMTVSEPHAMDQATEVMKRARRAADELASLTLEERVAAITSLKRVILENDERIVEAICKETGKTKTDAYVSEIFSTLDHLQFLEKHAVRALRDERVPTPIALMGKKSVIHYEPMGVVLIISPWNYPFFMGIVPITSALVCGNAVIYKPSEHTPLTGLFEDLCRRAGFASDWVQVAYGDGARARELIDLVPDKIFFTGSVETGRKVMGQAAQHLIPVELELGGKDPMIVFADADLERATAGALWGALTNLGQACTSVERLYVQRPVYDEFKSRLIEKARRLVQQASDPDGDVDLGRMTAPFQVAKIKEQLAAAKARGARVHTGEGWDGESPLIPPTIVDGVPEDAALACEETFGPVVTLFPFDTEDEAIRLANDSVYGLSASVWTKDMQRARRVTRKLACGNVSINNVMLTEGNSNLPFGGIKASGIGRYRGVYGLRSFCNVKSALYDKNSSKIEANWFPYTKKKYALFRTLTHQLYGSGVARFLNLLITAIKLETWADRTGKKGRP